MLILSGGISTSSQRGAGINSVCCVDGQVEGLGWLAPVTTGREVKNKALFSGLCVSAIIV